MVSTFIQVAIHRSVATEYAPNLDDPATLEMQEALWCTGNYLMPIIPDAHWRQPPQILSCPRGVEVLKLLFISRTSLTL